MEFERKWEQQFLTCSLVVVLINFSVSDIMKVEMKEVVFPDKLLPKNNQIDAYT